MWWNHTAREVNMQSIDYCHMTQLMRNVINVPVNIHTWNTTAKFVLRVGYKVVIKAVFQRTKNNDRSCVVHCNTNQSHKSSQQVQAAQVINLTL